jgi:hypothetical protein
LENIQYQQNQQYVQYSQPRYLQRGRLSREIKRECGRQLLLIRERDIIDERRECGIPCSRPDNVIYRPDAHLSKASSVRMTRTFHPDLPLCQEASNCSNLHASERFSSTSRRHSVFDQLWDFLPKHRYRKNAATFRMTWIPV